MSAPSTATAAASSSTLVVDFGWGNAARGRWVDVADLPLAQDELARRRLINEQERVAIEVHRLTLDWPGLKYVPRPHGPSLEIDGVPGRVVAQGPLAQAEALAHHRRTWHGRAR